MIKPKAYYNEIDPFCVDWLRNLIKAGHIADGVVDNRSIVDVTPIDLKEFTQCHFFAGIGVWSYALRRAGWSDDRRVWTGSCPCQPFSAAGSGKGFDDERHLWPYFFHLIEQCRPNALFGEQVASSDGLEWIDLVQSDMEGAKYAFAASDFCSAGVGAPHIRQRLYFFGQSLDRLADAYNYQHRGPQRRGDVIAHGKEIGNGQNVALAWQLGGTSDPVLLGMGHTDDTGLEGLGGGHQTARRGSGSVRSTAETSELSGLADNHTNGRSTLPEQGLRTHSQHDLESYGDLSGLADADSFIAELLGEDTRREGSDEREIAIRYGDLIGLGNTELHGSHEVEQSRRTHEEMGLQQPQGSSDNAIGLADTSGGRVQEARRGQVGRIGESGISQELEYSGPTNGFWRSADWLLCRDGKFRPVKPDAFVLVDGATSRVGRLRAYGNAINAEAAKTFIEAATDGLFGLDLI